MFDRPDGNLVARREAQFVEDVLDMRSNGALADDQPPGDLPIRHLLRQQGRNLALADHELGAAKCLLGSI